MPQIFMATFLFWCLLHCGIMHKWFQGFVSMASICTQCKRGIPYTNLSVSCWPYVPYEWCEWMLTRGPFHQQFFYCNSMEIWFCCHLDSNKVNTTKFGTWHDSIAVVSCAKICCNLTASNCITPRWNLLSNLNFERNIVCKIYPGWQ